MSIDGLSLIPLVAELNGKLAGGRIDKIFQPDKLTLIIWIRQPGVTYKLLISAQAGRQRIHLTEEVPDNPAAPPVFCMLLRKHLADGRISEICQVDSDRIVIINIDVIVEQGMIATKQLIIELMGKHSNIIFVYQEIILDAIRRVSAHMSRQRQVLPGRNFSLPPAQGRLNLISDDATCIAMQTAGTSGSLAKALMANVAGMGPVTAREILWRSGLPTDITTDRLDAADTQSLAAIMTEIGKSLSATSAEPTVAVHPPDKLAGVAAFQLEHLQQAEQKRFSTMTEAVAYADSLQDNRQIPLLQELAKTVSTEINRLVKKHAILTEELDEALGSELLRRQADTLMIHLYAIPDRVETVDLPDLFAHDQPGILTIPLNPRLSPLANAQQYYAAYNKLQRRQQQTSLQLAECSRELAYLESVSLHLAHDLSAQEAEEIRAELISSGYLPRLKRPRTAVAANSQPWETCVQGVPILAGRNNLQNDRLTFKTGHPDDIWLHTKDIPGSHVIIRCGQSAPDETVLAAAAQIAAWLSKARLSANVPVDYTRRRHVKKPSGAKPGYVIYDKQQTLYITPDEELVKNLLRI